MIGRRIKNIGHWLIALLANLYYRRPATGITFIGVTGTDGKTTTSHLIYKILKTAHEPVGLISTIGAFWNNHQVDVGLHTTTPAPGLLQKLIAQMRAAGTKYIVLETTSHALDQHRVFGIPFALGIITNITPEHLDYHHSFTSYRQTKAKLLQRAQVAILNRDDPSYPFLRRLLSQQKNKRIITFGRQHPAHFRARLIKFQANGTRFQLQASSRQLTLQTPLVGLYNVANILAAVAAVRQLGIGWPAIRQALQHFAGVPGRMQLVSQGQSFPVIIDFAHTPNALFQVLQTLRQLLKPPGRLIVVFGAAGERDRQKRPQMGKIATRLADITILTAEDPRHERVADIIQQIASGIGPKVREVVPVAPISQSGRQHVFSRQPDRQQAIALAINSARRNDIVVICGKGHEKSMNYNGRELPWSDFNAAQKALQRRRKREGIAKPFFIA